MAFSSYINTWVLVSGSRSPTRPPHTRTVEARRIGIALVIPTREPNIKFPSTAAALHSAFKNPKPVALEEKTQESLKNWSKRERDKSSVGINHYSPNILH